MNRFGDGDYISCVAILYPRIEGILRKVHQLTGSTQHPSQSALSRSATAHVGNPMSLLLPKKFQDYLKRVYFAGFAPGSFKEDVSRHSVGHGVADQSRFDKRAAIISILIVQQLNYCAPIPEAAKSPSSDKTATQ
jgi:hypothetical protein